MYLAFFPFKYNIQKGLLSKGGEIMKQISCFINNSYNWNMIYQFSRNYFSPRKK